MQTCRLVSDTPIEFRADGDRPKIRGYAAVFNALSHDLGGYREIIRPGAFDEVLRSNPDVACNVQHMGGLSTIGRTTNGSLRLWIDARGLGYECTLPDTQAGRDMAQLCKDGLINRSSFAFLLGEGGCMWDWSKTPAVREIVKVAKLVDVAPVDGPAYQQTSVEARSLAMQSLGEAMAGAGEAGQAQSAWVGNSRCEVRAEAGKRVAKLYILDAIDKDWVAKLLPGIVSGKMVMQMLADAGEKDEIEVYLNSPGGDVFEANLIHNTLKEDPAPVTWYVQGLAASAASFLPASGDRVVMGAGAMIMIHKAWSRATGNSDEMKKQAGVLDKIDGEIAGHYMRRAGGTEKEWLARMKAETWLTGREAVALGLATEVADDDVEAVASVMRRDYTGYGWTQRPSVEFRAQIMARTTRKHLEQEIRAALARR